jgi:hypothetical protein
VVIRAAVERKGEGSEGIWRWRWGIDPCRGGAVAGAGLGCEDGTLFCGEDGWRQGVCAGGGRGSWGLTHRRLRWLGIRRGAHISLLAAATAESESTTVTSGVQRDTAGGGDREFGDESESVGAVAAFFALVMSDGSVALTLGCPGHRGMLGLSGAAAVESAPMEYASEGVLPPVLLLHGTKNGLVPHEPNSVAMFESLRAAGTATDLRLGDGVRMSLCGCRG